jgi:hypothetical protein
MCTQEQGRTLLYVPFLFNGVHMGIFWVGMGMCKLTLHLMAYRTTASPANIFVKKVILPSISILIYIQHFNSYMTMHVSI